MTDQEIYEKLIVEIKTSQNLYQDEKENLIEKCKHYHTDVKVIILSIFETDDANYPDFWDQIDKNYRNYKFNNKLEDILDE